MCVCPRSWTPDIELDDATIGQQAPYVVMLPDSEFQVSHDHMCVRCMSHQSSALHLKQKGCVGP